MSDTESRWFKIIVTLLSAVIIGVTIANLVYYNKIRTGSCNAVSSGEATTMLWINVVLLVIGAVVFIWSLYRLFVSHDTHQQVKHYMVSPESGMNMGYQAQVPQTLVTQPVATAPPVAVATSTDTAAMVVSPNEYQTLAAQQQYL